MRWLAPALCAALAGCATASPPAGHPVGRAAPGVPVASHAQPVPPPRCTLPSEPAFPDSDAALASAAGLVERVKRLREGRDERIEYERKLREACR